MGSDTRQKSPLQSQNVPDCTLNFQRFKAQISIEERPPVQSRVRSRGKRVSSWISLDVDRDLRFLDQNEPSGAPEGIVGLVLICRSR